MRGCVNLFFAVIVMTVMSASFVSCNSDEDEEETVVLNQYYGCVNIPEYGAGDDFVLVVRTLNKAFVSVGAIDMGSKAPNRIHCYKGGNAEIVDKKIKEACDAAINNFDRSRISTPVGVVVYGNTLEKYEIKSFHATRREIAVYVIEPK